MSHTFFKVRSDLNLHHGKGNADFTVVYCFGFNGQEKNNDLYKSSLEFKLRVYSPELGRFLSCDPLYMDYPYLSTFSFAGNSVLCFIDIDGAEPGVIFPSITPFTQLQDANKVQTENWKAIRATNWADMKAALVAHKSIEVNKDFQYLVITTHGNRKGIVIGPKISSSEDKSSGFDVTGDFGVTIESWDLDKYKEYQKKGDAKFRKWYKADKFNYGNEKRTYDSWADNEAQGIKGLLDVLSEVPDGGTVVFFGCDAGQSEEFMKGMFELSGSRLNIIMNSSDTAPKGSLLNSPLNNCDEGTSGWRKIGPNTNGQVQNLSGTEAQGYLQLNECGENIQVNSKPCEDD